MQNIVNQWNIPQFGEVVSNEILLHGTIHNFV